MRRGCPQSRKRQVRKPPCDGRCEALKQLALALIEVAQLFGKRAISLLSRNLFECTPQIRQATPYRARRQLAAQASESLVNGSTHGRKPHELCQTPLLRRLDQIVHTN